MMKNNLLLSGLAFSLIACGGGGGGGEANDGGFQKPRKPELRVTFSPDVISPNVNNKNGSQHSARAMVYVQALQSGTPLENGDEELTVTINDSSTTRGVLYCFLDNDTCVEEAKDSEGKTVRKLKPWGNFSLDLADGKRKFAVESAENKEGFIGVTVSVNGADGSYASKDIKIPVKNRSTGIAHQIRIDTADALRTDQVSNIIVSLTDEAGNPVDNPKTNNLIVTVNNLPGTTLGLNGDTGISVSGESENGRAILSVLPTQNGFLTITAQSDKDNNIENGIQNLMTASKTVRVADDAITVTPDVIITGTSLPNGVVGVDYGEFTVAVSGTTSNISIESGNFPPGLSFNQGVITGKPTLAGDYKFTVKATGANSSEDTKEFSIKVIEGGFKFSIDSFDSIAPIKDLDPQKPDTCINVGQLLSIEPVEGYQPKPPIKWTMDAGDVQTALGKNKAERVVSANGVKLVNLDFTVTNDTTTVTLNGKVCPSAPAGVFNGHAIILNATDANGFTHESILPLAINLKVNPYTPQEDKEEEEKINELTLPVGTINTPYGQTIPGTKSSSISSGKLPEGLSFANGVLSGTPKEKGVFTFTVVEGKTTNKVILTIQ